MNTTLLITGGLVFAAAMLMAWLARRQDNVRRQRRPSDWILPIPVPAALGCLMNYVRGRM